MTQQELNTDEAQIGRILHFVIDKGDRPQCRPAIVIHDWPDQGKPGYVNLAVFPDGSNDDKYGIDDHKHKLKSDISLPIGEDTSQANVPLMIRWETSCMPNHAVRVVRSWHWPRECGGLGDPPEPVKGEHNVLYYHNHTADVKDPHNCPACIQQKRPAATVKTDNA